MIQAALDFDAAEVVPARLSDRLPHAPGSETSRLAALRGRPRAGSQKHQVLVHLAGYGAEGVTDAALCDWFATERQARWDTARCRRCDLVAAGLAEKAPSRVISEYGNEVERWRVSALGWAYLQERER